MKKKKKTQKLKIVFDTNILWTRIAHDLLRNEINNLITSNNNHDDIDIQWYIPSVVLEERRYQMYAEAHKLLKHTQKVEAILGHNLNITEDILSNRVDHAIQKQLELNSLEVLNFDTTKVNWDSIITRSVKKIPPFENNGKEKGFRDALIAESFFQLIKNSPITPSTCRIILLTEDKFLTEYAQEKTKNKKNIRIFNDINEIKGLIKTLSSDITEDFINKILPSAINIFYDPNKQEGIYTSEDMYNKIYQQFNTELIEISMAGNIRENGKILIHNPRFNEKNRQRIHWISTITIDFLEYKWEIPKPTIEDQVDHYKGLSAETIKLIQFNAPDWPPVTQSKPPERKVILEGKVSFDVYWSVNVTSTDKLTRAKVDKIEFSGKDIS